MTEETSFVKYVISVRERTKSLMEERAIEIENGLLHETPAMTESRRKLDEQK